MKTRFCSACNMLSQGVKFRKAPEHTCDKSEPKTIKIPKVDPNGIFDVLIQRTGIITTPKAYKLRTRKQEIEGVTIPNGHEFWTPQCVITHEFSANPVAHIKGHVINDMLRFIVLKKIRET